MPKITDISGSFSIFMATNTSHYRLVFFLGFSISHIYCQDVTR